MIPGLWDGHAHVLQYGEMLSNVKLYGAESIDGMICNSIVCFIFCSNRGFRNQEEN